MNSNDAFCEVIHTGKRAKLILNDKTYTIIRCAGFATCIDEKGQCEAPESDDWEMIDK